MDAVPLATLYKNSYSRDCRRRSGCLVLSCWEPKRHHGVVSFYDPILQALASVRTAGWAVSYMDWGSIAGAYLGGRSVTVLDFIPNQFGRLFLGGNFFILLIKWNRIHHNRLHFFLSMVTNLSGYNATPSRTSHAGNRTQAFSSGLAINMGWGIG